MVRLTKFWLNVATENNISADVHVIGFLLNDRTSI